MDRSSARMVTVILLSTKWIVCLKEIQEHLLKMKLLCKTFAFYKEFQRMNNCISVLHTEGLFVIHPTLSECLQRRYRVKVYDKLTIHDLFFENSLG